MERRQERRVRAERCCSSAMQSADSKSNRAALCVSRRSPARTPLRSKRVMRAGSLDQLAMSGLSGGSTATRACTGSSISRNRTAAAHDQPRLDGCAASARPYCEAESEACSRPRYPVAIVESRMQGRSVRRCGGDRVVLENFDPKRPFMASMRPRAKAPANQRPL